MPEKLYKKIGRKYVECGYEFSGFPADGIWLVQDGRRNCLIRLCDIKDLPKITALPYLAMTDDALKEVSQKVQGKSVSLHDIVKEVALFFAENADKKEAREKKQW